MKSLIFLGHVDHGKSTLSGKYALLSKHFDSHQADRFKESSHVFDIMEDEQKRSKTFETSILDMKDKVILDAPGHKNYISSAIQCISRADIAVIVVSARKGEFETGIDKGQTMEHIIISKVYGINSIIVAINKMDSIEWSQYRFKEIQERMQKILRGKWKDNQIQYVPVSGHTGEGIIERSTIDWCNMFPTLSEAIDKSMVRTFEKDTLLRLPIANACNNTISGRITSGTLRGGDTVYILPINKPVKIQGKDIYYAGSNVNIEVTTDSFDEIRSGYVIANTVERSANMFHAKISFLEHSYIISGGKTFIMHCHNIIVQVTVEKILAIVDKDNKITQKEPSFITSKDKLVYIKFSVADNIFIEKQSRIIIRDSDYVIGMGVITQLL